MKFIMAMIKVAVLLAIVILVFGVVILGACSFIEWSWRPFVDFYLTNINSVTAKGLRLFIFFYTIVCFIAAVGIRFDDKERRIY